MNSKHTFLFILDAVRKDHVGLYGYKRKTTPNIDKLAKKADVYNWAFAPAPYTLASVPSILAGKYPIELSNSFTGGEFDRHDFETLKELRKQGYTTAMFTANIVTSSYKTNLNQFFDYFWDNLTEKELNRPVWLYQKAEVVLAAVEAFVEKHKSKKFFVVVHLMEAHGPYVPKIESIFKGDAIYKKDKRLIDRLVPTTLRGVTQATLAKYKIMPRYQALMYGDDYERNVREYVAKYDMGIYLLDKSVGKFLTFLQKNKLYEPSQIIITSDHGELLGEENIFFAHGVWTHPVLTSVPLIIKFPYQTKKIIRKANYSLIYVIPKLLEKEVDQGLVASFYPRSISVIIKNKYYMFHNGSFGENDGSDFWPLEWQGFARVISNISQIKIKPLTKVFCKHNLVFRNINDNQTNELFAFVLNLEKQMFQQVVKKLNKPKRSERLAIKMFISSLLAENQIKRIWMFIKYKLGSYKIFDR